MLNRLNRQGREGMRSIGALLLAANCGLVGVAGAFAGVEHLWITEVRPSTGEVEVTNTGVEAVTVDSALPFSHRLQESAAVSAGTVFAGGESLVFVLPLDPDDSDVWLYREADFENPEAILSGIKYGPQENVGRTGIAVAAGIWPATDAYVPRPSAEESIRLNAMDGTDPGNWIHGEPRPGAFFGTGERVPNTLHERIYPSEERVRLVKMAEGLVSPIGLQDPDDGSGRLFILDQAGTIHVLLDGQLLAEPFLDVRDRLIALRQEGYESRGFLGFVLHPDFPANPRIYTHTSEPVDGPADLTFPNSETVSADHQSVIAEWQVDPQNPDRIDPDSRREIVRIDQPGRIHNAGTLEFGPDGYFYFSLGDGSGEDDVGPGHAPEGNSQSLATAHGSILRIDLAGSDGASGQYGIPADNPFIDDPGAIDEIYAYGLRNPYMFSFDLVRETMFIADTGQHESEAIYIGQKGANYGWRLKEGSLYFRPNPDGRGYAVTVPEAPLPPDIVDPVAEYSNTQNVQAIIGGYVYWGAEVPHLSGRYVFADFGTSWSGGPLRLFYLDDDHAIRQPIIEDDPDLNLHLLVKGLAQDARGEIYVFGSNQLPPAGETGRVYRITSDAVVPKLAIATVERVNGTIRIEFESGLSAEQHRLEARGSLTDAAGWVEVEVAIEEAGEGLFRIDVPVPETNKHFYRIRRIP